MRLQNRNQNDVIPWAKEVRDDRDDDLRRRAEDGPDSDDRRRRPQRPDDEWDA